jgi:hypothetical protein
MRATAEQLFALANMRVTAVERARRATTALATARVAVARGTTERDAAQAAVSSLPSTAGGMGAGRVRRRQQEQPAEGERGLRGEAEARLVVWERHVEAREGLRVAEQAQRTAQLELR